MKMKKRLKRRRESKRNVLLLTTQRNRRNQLSLQNHQLLWMSNRGMMKQIWSKLKGWYALFKWMEWYGVHPNLYQLDTGSRNCKLYASSKMRNVEVIFLLRRLQSLKIMFKVLTLQLSIRYKSIII